MTKFMDGTIYREDDARTTYTFRPETLRAICVKNDWFNAGTNSQYDKLFDMNRAGEPIETLALIIWTCTDGTESVREIAERLNELFDMARA